jgi:hypothetical protein
MTETLSEASLRLRADTVDRVPGRLATLIETRVRQLLGLAVQAGLPDDLTPAERVVIDVTEQFVVDVHGLTDEQFGALGEFYGNADQIAIMFHLALVEGFGKLEKLDLERIRRVE